MSDPSPLLDRAGIEEAFRRAQTALSRSYMNRKNQRGAVMAATLPLADVRLLAE